jgi:hypothetical protein
MIPITMTRFLLIMATAMYLGGCATATTSGTRETPPEISAHIYNKDFDTVFIRAIDAACAMGWQVNFTDKSTGVISARTPTNFWTWGDNVSIRVYRIENNAAKVDISSGTPNQIVDWGRNKRNILDYYGKLDNLVYSGQ